MEPIQFGKYQLLKQIAIGGMAEIFLARQLGLSGFEKLVVVKRILPHLASQPRFVDMFLDEARLAAGLAHPNVVQIYDLGREGEAYYIAMEFIPGQDLTRLVRKARALQQFLPIEVSTKIIAGACEGLYSAHTHTDLSGQPLNLVHRDISPSNIIVGYSGTVKVVDFGIAKAASSNTKTQTGLVKGKVPYMSPEQVRGRPLDARSDIFALGVTLYELYVGRRLFKRDSEVATMRDISEGQVPRPSTLRKELPHELDAAVMKALEKDPKRRFASARDMQLALEEWMAKQSRPFTNVDIADYMGIAFAQELAAYRALLAELPKATPTALAALLAKQYSDGSGSDSQSLNGSDDRSPSRSGSTRAERARKTGDLSLDVDIEDMGVDVRQRMPVAVRLAITLAFLLVAVVGGGAYWWFQLRPTASVAAAPVDGKLQISSTPPGASVTINGAPTGKVTPVQLEHVSFGDVEVKLELTGHEPRTVRDALSADVPARAIALELRKVQAAKGRLRVETTPPGARLSFDGRPIEGVTPQTVSDVEPEAAHYVELSLNGYGTELKQVSVKSGESGSLTVALRRVAVEEATKSTGPKKPGRELAEVELVSTPEADVSMGGHALCHTPCKAKLPVGKVELAFQNAAVDLYAKASITVDKRGGKQEVVFRKGKLAAQIEPWADVYLGNKKLGTTPLAPREVYEGTYSLRLVNSELGAIRNIQATVEAGKTTVIREKLE